MLESVFRNDEYGKNFYIEKNGKIQLIPYKCEKYEKCGLEFSVKEKINDGVLEIFVEVTPKVKVDFERFGFRLGIDTYMESYPQWNDKYFPTALRCEKTDFGPALWLRTVKCCLFVRRQK